ncbi:MAG: hypothetical protein WA395_13000 [Nitrososphaeraceae archaeon]
MSAYEFMNRIKMQENRSTEYNKKMKKKLRTIVLSPNVNDYDTGENIVLYKRRDVDTNSRDIFV